MTSDLAVGDIVVDNRQDEGGGFNAITTTTTTTTTTTNGTSTTTIINRINKLSSEQSQHNRDQHTPSPRKSAGQESIREAGHIASSSTTTTTITQARQNDQQTLDIFVKHVSLQQERERQQHRRSSLPGDAIELQSLSGVVMRRKQQLQMRQQNEQQQNHTHDPQANQKQVSTPTAHKFLKPNVRPLSISSISSAASSASHSSASSSSSSGIQSSLTRNSSLNYGQINPRSAHLASIESINNLQSAQSETQTMEIALKNLNLTPSGQFKDPAARAAVLSAGVQSCGFSIGSSPSGTGFSRINRSLHASLRYDKNTAYRIHLMATTRSLLNRAQNGGTIENTEYDQLNRISPISRNNSSTSSDSGHHDLNRTRSKFANSPRFMCQCLSEQSIPARSITSSSLVARVDRASTLNESESTDSLATPRSNSKAATLDSGSCQRITQHHPNCSYSRAGLPRGLTKMQPSSNSSHSNTSSLFQDDGFEDDFTSTASEMMSNSHQHHRLSFQGRNQARHSYRSSRACEDEDEYQSCEEEFTNTTTTASSTSNLDDCALSTTSSSIIHHHTSRVLDKISLANAKQQYRRSLLLEHHQQQHLLHSQHLGQQNKIQSLLTPIPKLCQLGSSSPNSSIATSTTSSASCVSPSKLAKCDDRTVNIIGHMPTKSPGYWDSNLSISQRVVTEIIETERTYVDDLEQIVTGYICYLRNVLKQHQKSQNIEIAMTQRRRLLQSKPDNSSTDMMVSVNTEDDDKSIMVFDDDATSATNEVVDDYDVEEADSENLPKYDKAKIDTLEGAIITAGDIKKLFSNLEDIYKFNKDLLFRLEECYLNPSSVAECFVENASGFEVYTHYCTMYPQVVSTLTELMGNQTSAQLLKERQNDLNQGLPLGAYLLKPVQRILKYHILFQSLIKHTTDDNSVGEKDRQLINEACSVMTNIACHINAMKKRHEHSIRVQEVQGLLNGWQGPDLTTLGELILEDTFKLYNRPKSNRHLFLFDNVLLITKKQRDGSLCYKGHIACSNLMLIENIVGQPLVFNTVPFDNPKALCAFQAKNLDKKRDWCLQMKEVIIKSFDVKIPVHVRDILMSLTNSNSTETNSKSSSETGRALRAPNYLDKKRAKQNDKKK